MKTLLNWLLAFVVGAIGIVMFVFAIPIAIFAGFILLSVLAYGAITVDAIEPPDT